MITDTLKGYGLEEIGRIEMPDQFTFRVILANDAFGLWKKAIYAFVVGDEIKRIGSSKGPLRVRFRGWNKNVTDALHGDPEATKIEEAEKWAACIKKHGVGRVFARVATTVTTPIGTFEAYMDEESVLINRFKPPLNNHSNR